MYKFQFLSVSPYIEGDYYAYWKVRTRVFLYSLNDENMSFIAMKYRRFLKVRKTKTYNKPLDLLDNLRVKLVADISFGTS